MDLKDIQNLIKFVAKSGASEVKLEMEDIKITIKTGTERTETTILQQAPSSIPQMTASSGQPTPSNESVQTMVTELGTKEATTKYIEINSIEVNELIKSIIKITKQKIRNL